LIVVGPQLKASPGTKAAFRGACSVTPWIELGSEFSTLEAGEAGIKVLNKVRASLQMNAGTA